MHKTSRALALVGGGCIAAALAWSGDDAFAAGPTSSAHRLVDVANAPGKVIAFEHEGRLERLYGAPMAHGPSPVASAEAFLDANAGLIGAERADLVPLVRDAQGGNTVPVMYDAARGVYKFTAVYYRQERNGVPVYGARVTALVRNEGGFPLVLVNPDTRDLSRLNMNQAMVAGEIAGGARDGILERAFEVSTMADQPALETTEKVIWAGTPGQPAAAVLADRSVVSIGVDSWEFVTDAATGRILHEEQLICFVDVAGNISGNVTEGIGADICEEEVAMGLPHLRVTAGADEAYTDANGDYLISGLLGFPVDVTGRLSGLWFDVFNFGGTDSAFAQNVTPPATVDHLFNAANTSELVRAEANGYFYSNFIRDWVLVHNPSYPTLADGGFPVNVNRTDGFCPGNAWYSPGDVTINFCQSSSTRANTSWSSVIYHEYGHHLVQAGGSGQGAYGEGTGDVMSVVILDDPNLGFGFFNDCISPLRTADNDCQYDPVNCSTCGSAIHACGNLYSGAVWSTRNELVVTEPVKYQDILGCLAVNSILIHSGSSITPSITVDYLVLDDDNGTIFDGTPHYAEIAAGFGAHSLDAPDLADLGFSFPNGLPEFVSPSGSTTVRVEVTGIVGSPQPGTGVMFYDDGGGAVAIPMAQVSPNVYDGTFPAAPCGTSVTYYFAADTTAGDTQLWPIGAPAERFSAFTAVGQTVALTDDMEADNGWNVLNEALDDGQWDRGVPAGGGDRGDPAVDFDGSGQCWLTDNVDGNSDVDGGPTRLISYPIDLSAVSEPVISYARWFTNDDLDIDRLDVHVSNNGVTWVLVESVGDNGGTWEEHSFSVSDYVTPNATVRVRFSATDNPNDSVTEAGIDDLRVVSLDCEEETCGADIDGNDVVGLPDLLAVLAAWGPCVGCPEDLDGDDVVGLNDLLQILSTWGPCP